MMKSVWVMTGILVFLFVLVGVIKNNINELTRIVGMTAFITAGYTIIIGSILIAILFIIKWVIKNKDILLN